MYGSTFGIWLPRIWGCAVFVVFTAQSRGIKPELEVGMNCQSQKWCREALSSPGALSRGIFRCWRCCSCLAGANLCWQKPRQGRDVRNLSRGVPSQRTLSFPGGAYPSPGGACPFPGGICPSQEELCPFSRVPCPFQEYPGPPQEEFVPPQEYPAPSRRILSLPRRSLSLPRRSLSLPRRSLSSPGGACPSPGGACPFQEYPGPSQEKSVPSQEEPVPSRRSLSFPGGVCPSQEELDPSQEYPGPSQEEPVPPQEYPVPSQEKSVLPRRALSLLTGVPCPSRSALSLPRRSLSLPRRNLSFPHASQRCSDLSVTLQEALSSLPDLQGWHSSTSFQTTGSREGGSAPQGMAGRAVAARTCLVALTRSFAMVTTH